ncbi:conserved hypothetical protein [Histoplasma capsulatum H143]|uniref:Altered inheritance of mitochondria protein 9, mitochondrial n=1 Tax=Ajellomyces capsulatus (strain H143) TaxID=544712 RepID=C6HMW8_AJECH|nr:conserved hypothetical protein [Histoplasma capsulatum H143]
MGHFTSSSSTEDRNDAYSVANGFRHTAMGSRSTSLVESGNPFRPKSRSGMDILRDFTMIRQPSAACYLTRHSLWNNLASKSLRTPQSAGHPSLDLPPRNCAQHSTGHAMTPKSAPYKDEVFDPHTYTGGRWFRHDKLERDSRYIKFNFSALCQRILELCPGAGLITSYQKTEGGFNRVFIFTLSNVKWVMVRLPFTLAGPSKLATSSEVAMIKYPKTSIPIPLILNWSNDSTNSIDSKYIIMKHTTDVQLHNKWPDMAADQQNFPLSGACFLSIVHWILVTKLLWMRCFVSDLTADLGIDVRTNLDHYCDSLIDAGISRIPPVDTELEKQASFHGSTELHINLLKYTRTVLKRMSSDSQVQSAATPVLFHPDLHKWNIFVSEDDPSIVPDFAEPGSLCTKTFAVCSQFLTPKLSGPRLMDGNIFQSFCYSYRTWKDSTVALIHKLIETSQSWKELELAGFSSYPLPTQKELVDHEREYKLFVAVQNLKCNPSSLLNTTSDGWVPLEDWEETKSAHWKVFDSMLNAVLTNDDSDYDEPVKDEKVLRSIWPFDLNT